mmetsp:Transcript_15964/g.56790  ORF Transcript_15964/g.56790 Transcript_15964/m.56790 type:complete len:407 (+) Transcript_15964:385-1605(+)
MARSRQASSARGSRRCVQPQSRRTSWASRSPRSWTRTFPGCGSALKNPMSNIEQQSTCASCVTTASRSTCHRSRSSAPSTLNAPSTKDIANAALENSSGSGMVTLARMPPSALRASRRCTASTLKSSSATISVRHETSSAAVESKSSFSRAQKRAILMPRSMSSVIVRAMPRCCTLRATLRLEPAASTRYATCTCAIDADAIGAEKSISTRRSRTSRVNASRSVLATSRGPSTGMASWRIASADCHDAGTKSARADMYWPIFTQMEPSAARRCATRGAMSASTAAKSAVRRGWPFARRSTRLARTVAPTYAAIVHAATVYTSAPRDRPTPSQSLLAATHASDSAGRADASAAAPRTSAKNVATSSGAERRTGSATRNAKTVAQKPSLEPAGVAETSAAAASARAAS